MKNNTKKELGITAEKDDFSEWFTQLMIKSDLADYTEVSGCIIFKPNSYEIWENFVEKLNKKFKEIGIQNCYFPLLIPEKYLNKEKEHIKGFSPEVAWVTQAGDSILSERLAVRPTSETIMYPSFSKWIRSWRELPLRLNQWNNVLRWEFKHPVPFFRTREFLWNELHTANETKEQAIEEGKQILKIYKEFCEKELALYGLEGKKTEKEKFAGGDASYKLHYILPSGRVIEGPCWHYDAQNFAKAYNIKFLNKDEKEEFVYQNTYAITTRMLGTMFAIHSNEKGLIIPPNIATKKLVIIPILFENSKEEILKTAEKIKLQLKEFNPILDSREEYKPGFKFNEYELKGIPLRIEIGPKDIEKNQVTLVRRDNLKKQEIKISKLKKEIPSILEDIQKSLFEKSKKLFESKIEKTNNLKQLISLINDKKVGIIPFCKNEKCEDLLKIETNGAKALFIAKEKISEKDKCIICNKKADYLIYAGKSY